MHKQSGDFPFKRLLRSLGSKVIIIWGSFRDVRISIVLFPFLSLSWGWDMHSSCLISLQIRMQFPAILCNYLYLAMHFWCTKDCQKYAYFT